MVGLSKKSQKSIIVNGAEIPINTDYRACVITWNDFCRVKNKEIDILIAIVTVYRQILCKEPDDDLNLKEAQQVANEVSKYLDKYARSNDIEDDIHSPNLIDFELDENYIRDAYLLLGADLYADDMDYPKFMMLFRLIATTKAPYCRILYLRSQHKRKKLTKEEKEEIDRSWGWNLIKMVNTQKQKQIKQHDDEFLAEKNRLRKSQGLPPI